MKSLIEDKKIAVLDIKRIQSLSDGIFAVACTILILELKIPDGLDHVALVRYLSTAIIYKALIFVITFVLLSTYWIDSHFHHHLTTKTDKVNIWLNILFLMFICMIPFSSSLLANYLQDSLSIIIFSSNLICASLCHLFMLQYLWKKKYVLPHISTILYNNLKLRIVVPIVIYIIIIPLSLWFSKWIISLFMLPLGFQIIYGRSKQEITE